MVEMRCLNLFNNSSWKFIPRPDVVINIWMINCFHGQVQEKKGAKEGGVLLEQFPKIHYQQVVFDLALHLYNGQLDIHHHGLSLGPYLPAKRKHRLNHSSTEAH